MIGQFINKFTVKDSSAGIEYTFKTLAGADRRYDKLDAENHNVAIYQETDCVNELIAIKSNWFQIAE